MRPLFCSPGDFYPRPPRGGRPTIIAMFHPGIGFLSTPSARRATPAHLLGLSAPVHFYPRPPRGGRQHIFTIALAMYNYFYPRPPRGGRQITPIRLSPPVIFLSTPSARRATCRSNLLPGRYRYFYPRPPRGGRLAGRTDNVAVIRISIHALREEGDRRNCCTAHSTGHFYPRPPRGGRQAECATPVPNSIFLSTPSARRAT